jgi:alpha-glucosidase (family GH31 glycosyl hydrolase)
MYYGSMENASAFEAKDQYFFGSELLAAPILTPSRPDTGIAVKRVWFPAGNWFSFFSGEQVASGKWIEIKAALEDIPVYAKAGAIIPLAPKVGWGGIDNPTELDIHLFPGADNTFDLYEDDGETTDYQCRKYAITKLETKVSPLWRDQSQAISDSVLTFTIHPAEGDLSIIPATRAYRLHLRGVDETATASIPGKYESATRTLSLEVVALKSTETFTVTFK